MYYGYKICRSSEYIRVLNISGFIKKTLNQIDLWQDSKYSSGSEHVTVLNMPGLHKVLNNTLYYRYLIGF